MTLILSARTPGAPIHLISDVALVRNLRTASPILLPHVQYPKEFKFADMHISGMMQKTISIGYYSFQWAGSRRLSGEIFKIFYQRTLGGLIYYPISEILREAKLQDSPDVSVLCYFFGVDGTATESSYGVGLHAPFGINAEIKAAGSGVWDFLDNHHARYPAGYPIQPIEDLIMRLASRVVEPWFFEEKTLEMGYGSWLELSRQYGRSVKKIPMAFKFWLKDGDGRGYSTQGPLLFSQYIGHDLVLASFNHDRSDREQRFALKLVTPLTTLFIADPLNRRPPNAFVEGTGFWDYTLTNFKFEPEILVNVFARLERGKIRTTLSFIDNSLNNYFTFSPTGSDRKSDWLVSYHPNLLEAVIERRPNLGVDTYNPWDD